MILWLLTYSQAVYNALIKVIFGIVFNLYISSFYLDRIGHFKSPSRSPSLYELLRFRDDSDHRLTTFMKEMYVIPVPLQSHLAC